MRDGSFSVALDARLTVARASRVLDASSSSLEMSLVVSCFDDVVKLELNSDELAGAVSSVGAFRAIARVTHVERPLPSSINRPGRTSTIRVT